jgi:hypothetical protein
MNIDVSKEKLAAMKTVEEDGLKLKFLDAIFRNDIDVVLAAIQENPYALEYASLDCRNNPLVVIPALESGEDVYQFVGRDFKIDRNIAVSLVRENGLNLAYLIFAYQDDEEIVRLAIQQNPEALYFASPRLKKDVDFVLDSIRGQEWAIEKADSSIVTDSRVVSAIDDEILRPLQEEYKEDLDTLKKLWIKALTNDSEMRFFFNDLEEESKFDEYEELYSWAILRDENFNGSDLESYLEGYVWDGSLKETIYKHYCDLPIELRTDVEIRTAVFELVDDWIITTYDEGVVRPLTPKPVQTSVSHSIQSIGLFLIDVDLIHLCELIPERITERLMPSSMNHEKGVLYRSNFPFPDRFRPFSIGFYEGIEITKPTGNQPLTNIDYFKSDKVQAVERHSVLEFDWKKATSLFRIKAQYVYWTTGAPRANMPKYDGSYEYFIAPKEVQVGMRILNKARLNLLVTEIQEIPQELLNENLDILGLAEDKVGSFYEHGVKTIRDLLTKSTEILPKISGFGSRKNKAYKDLELALNNLGLVLTRPLAFVRPTSIKLMSLDKAYYQSKAVLASEIDWTKFFSAHTNPLLFMDVDSSFAIKAIEDPVKNIRTFGTIIRLVGEDSRQTLIELLNHEDNKSKIVVPVLFEEGGYDYEKLPTEDDYRLATIPEAPSSESFKLPELIKP